MSNTQETIELVMKRLMDQYQLEKLYAEAYSNLRVDPRDAKSGMSGIHSRYSDYTLTELFENIWSYADIASESDCDLDTMMMYNNDISWMNEYIKCRLEVQEYVDNALEDGTHSEIA